MDFEQPRYFFPLVAFVAGMIIAASITKSIFREACSEHGHIYINEVKYICHEVKKGEEALQKSRLPNEESGE